MLKRFLCLVAILLAWSVPAHAAISRIGSCAAQTTACTFSVNPTAGDVILVFAHRDNVDNVVPTLPTPYGKINSNVGTSNTAIVGLRISDGTETTTGTWTNATSVAAAIYRGAHIAPVGVFANGNGVSTSIAYNGLTLNVTSGSSWVVGFAAHRTATNVGAAPTNMTLVTSATDIAVSDTNAGVTAWTTQSVTVNANSGWESYTFELVAPTGEDTTKLYVDNYLNLNTGDANGTTLTTTILGNGNQGAEDPASCSPATPTGFTIGAHVINALSTIRVRSTSTDYAAGSTARAEYFAHTASFTTCDWNNWYNTRKRGAVSIAAFVTFGIDNQGASGNLLDLWRVDTIDGDFCVMQLRNGTAAGSTYGVNIESNWNGTTVTTTHSTDITVTPGSTYWVVLHCNYQKGEGKLAIYNSAGTEISGSPITTTIYPKSSNGAFIDDLRVGNGEVETGTGSSSFEHLVIDYTAAKFPLGPSSAGGAGTHGHSMLGFGN